MERALNFFLLQSTNSSHCDDRPCFCRTDETVTYFHYGLPIFSHAKDDRASFRFITALLHVTCGAKQAELARAFGIPQINIKRAVKIYRASGSAGFFAERAHRGAAVLTEPVMQQAQSHSGRINN